MSGARITLITPPYQRISHGYEFVKHVTNRSPSLGLLHLAAQVRKHGYKPSIIESDLLGRSSREVAGWVAGEGVPYVGITLFTVGVQSAAEIARSVKESRPGSVVIVGGPHMSSMGPETMDRYPEFDLAITGEGERPLVLLLDALESGRSPREVPGLLYREGGGIRHTRPLEDCVDLDELEPPAWDLLPGFPAAYPPAIFDFPRSPVATVAASRGCPFHCRFCDTSTFGRRVRAYSPERLLEILKALKLRYGIRHVMFVDDQFLANGKRTRRLCELLLRDGIDLTWSCTARADSARPDLLALMKKAGCWQISFGLESGSDAQLERMEKRTGVARAEQAVRWTAEAGIRVKGLFMLGFPGETEETVQATRDFIRRAPLSMLNLSKFTPYPGSPIYRDIYGTDIRDDHWQRMNGMNFVWKSKGMAVERLDRHYRRILAEFYLRPGVLRRFIGLAMRHPSNLIRLSRMAGHFVRSAIRTMLRLRTGPRLEENWDRRGGVTP